MTYGTHLRRSRHGTLHFRYVIPSDARGSVGKSEISISLGTASKREAELACLELQLAAKRIIAAVREADRLNEPRKPNLAALHALVEKRRFTVVLGELHEADAVIAAQAEQIAAQQALHAVQSGRIEALSALHEKLFLRLDVPETSSAVDTGPALAEAIGTFKAEKNAIGKWTSKTAQMWDSRLRLLLDWFGVVPASDISRNDMVEFFNALKLLPKNASKYGALDGLGLRQLVQAEGYDRIASSTVNLIMECVSALFAWMDADRTKWKVSLRTDLKRTREPTMTSRLTALAACFVVLATASLAFATNSRTGSVAIRAATAQVQVVQIERVVVTAKRLTTMSR